MSDEWDIKKYINDIDMIIQPENSLYFISSLLLPFGFVYLVFFKEFTELTWFSGLISFSIYFLVFFLIYDVFLRIKKRLEVKIFEKGVYFIYRLDICKDFEYLKEDISKISPYYRYASNSKSNFNFVYKWYANIFDSLENRFEKLILNFMELRKIITETPENVGDTKISYKMFVLVIFVSFILSMFMYFIFEFVKTIDTFRIVYILFFITLLFITYFLKFLGSVNFSLIIFLYRLIMPFAKRYLIWQKKWMGIK